MIGGSGHVASMIRKETQMVVPNLDIATHLKIYIGTWL